MLARPVQYYVTKGELRHRRQQFLKMLYSFRRVSSIGPAIGPTYGAFQNSLLLVFCATYDLKYSILLKIIGLVVGLG